MSKRRIVVTGLGMLSPVGLTVESSWQAILAGRSGIAFNPDWDKPNYPVKICGKLKNFNIEDHINSKDVRKTDPFTQFAMVAAEEAMQDSGIDVSKCDPHRFGAAIGSGIGGISTIVENHNRFLDSPRKVSPYFIPAGIINMAAGQISIRYGLKGPNIAIVSACTTGTHNIGEAARMIAYGDADIMLAGGSEMGTLDLCILGFAAARALSTRNDDPEKASRPWDKDRDGFVLGEGAGIVLLEEYEHAKKRGAKIYGELIGYGMSADAYHITTPSESGEGARYSMQNAIKDAGISPDSIDYINAHGTSTPTGDKVEARAVMDTFQDHASQLAISSTKSMTGHLLGAAGSVEAIFSLLALRDQVAPPTINLDNSDIEFPLNFVPHEAQPRKIDIVLSNSFGFGGTNGSLIFRRL